MKLSVLVIVYNQARYVIQAIDSILMQEVDFDYEVVIGEDASTDGTREIVLDFEKRYPDRIRVLLRDQAGAEADRAAGLGGKTNFIQSLKACRGEYIALLDGDDYWTDPGKLQRQVDFLDNHPDFAISCHNARMFYEDGSKEPTNLIPPDQKEVSMLEDLLLANIIPTCSTVFRRGLFGEFPDWFYTLKLGDWPLHILNAQHGKIGYINEVMASYRFHQGGFWSGLSLESQGLELIKMLDYLDVHLGFKYKKQVRAAQANWYWQVAQACHRNGDRAGTGRYMKKSFWLGSFRTRRDLLSFFLKLRTPTLYHALRSVKAFLHSVRSNSPRAVGS